MAPYNSQKLLIWTFPTIIALISYLWYKKKRIGVQSDPGDKILEKSNRIEEISMNNTTTSSIKIDNNNKDKEIELTTTTSPRKLYSRSLSGVDTAPIDIIMPRALRSSRSNPIVVSDEDLDLHIEKMKAMKHSTPSLNNNNNNNNNKIKTPNKSSKALSALTPAFTPSSLLLSATSSSTATTTVTTIAVVKKSPDSSTTLKINENKKQSPDTTKQTMTDKTKPQPPSSIKTNTTTTPNNNNNKKNKKNKSNKSKSKDLTTNETNKDLKISEKDSDKVLNMKNMDRMEESLKALSINNDDNNNNSNNLNEDDAEANLEVFNINNNNLEKSNTNENEEKEATNTNGGNSRDSANHSPVEEAILATSARSSISEHHSERSNDSGQGGSEVLTPPPPVLTTPDDEQFKLSYEFVIPQTLVGKLIGRAGASIKKIKAKTQAHIVVRKHAEDVEFKVCLIRGTEDQIDNALKMIRDKFPLQFYPEVTLEQIFHPQPELVSLPTQLPQTSYLKLIAGINNDTVLSCMVTPNHLFLHQPTHPTNMNLLSLVNFMNECYSDVDTPLLPVPLPQDTTICAAYSLGSWHRALVLDTNYENGMSYVKNLDYGGFSFIENENLRQIRGDCLLLPFQAIECMLYNIEPNLDANGDWAPEAYKLVSDLTQSQIITTQICDYTSLGIPLVNCYVQRGMTREYVLINEELVKGGFCNWIKGFDVNTQTSLSEEGAVGGEM